MWEVGFTCYIIETLEWRLKWTFSEVSDSVGVREKQ